MVVMGCFLLAMPYLVKLGDKTPLIIVSTSARNKRQSVVLLVIYNGKYNEEAGEIIRYDD